MNTNLQRFYGCVLLTLNLHCLCSENMPRLKQKIFSACHTYIEKIKFRTMLFFFKSPTLMGMQFLNALLGGIVGGLIVGLISYQLYKRNNKYIFEKINASIQKIHKKPLYMLKISL